MLGEFDAAITLSREAQQHANAAIHSYLAEMSALGLMERNDDAANAVARAQRVMPDVSVSYVAEILPITDDKYREIFHSGLRNAGLPEG